MAFIVEDGTGVVGANSYASVAQADAYFSDAGIAAWTGDPATKQGALVRATRYIKQRWPTLATVLVLGPGLTLPQALIDATCEYALRTLDGTTLAPDPTVDPAGFAVVTTMKKIGPLEKNFQVVGDKGQAMTFRSYPVPDGLIESLLTTAVSYGQRRVIR